MMVEQRSAVTGLQLQQALEQISDISTALSDVQRYYLDQVCVCVCGCGWDGMGVVGSDGE